MSSSGTRARLPSRWYGAARPCPWGACAVIAAFGLWFVRDNLGWTLLIQQTGRDEQRLQSDVPVFASFRRRPASARRAYSPLLVSCW